MASTDRRGLKAERRVSWIERDIGCRMVSVRNGTFSGKDAASAGGSPIVGVGGAVWKAWATHGCKATGGGSHSAGENASNP